MVNVPTDAPGETEPPDLIVRSLVPPSMLPLPVSRPPSLTSRDPPMVPLRMSSAPSLTSVRPVYVLSPASISTAVASCVSPPVPLMTPLSRRSLMPPKVSVNPASRSTSLLMIRALLFDSIVPLPASVRSPVPSAPLSPRMIVPMVSVVPPAYVFGPLSVISSRAVARLMFSAPSPLMVLVNPCVRLSPVNESVTMSAMSMSRKKERSSESDSSVKSPTTETSPAPSARSCPSTMVPCMRVMPPVNVF